MYTSNPDPKVETDIRNGHTKRRKYVDPPGVLGGRLRQRLGPTGEVCDRGRGPNRVQYVLKQINKI